MRQITFGTKEYSLCENPSDINDERFIYFKQHALKIFEKVDAKNLFAEVFSKCLQLWNSGNQAEVIIEMYNHKKAIELDKPNVDAYSICFALICLDEDEIKNQRGVSLSEDYQRRKLDHLRDHGLTRKTVEESVENFIKTSPGQFGVFSQLLEILPKISDEALNASLD